MKKHILGALMALTLLLTLFPATVATASGDSVSYALTNVTPFDGASVRVDIRAQSDCALFVGLYDENGKLLDVRTEKITGKAGEQFLSVTFNDDISDGLYAKAFLLNPNTFAPLCEGIDSIFRVEEYALIERISIETTADNVTTKTGSVLGLAYVNSAFTGANAENLQRAYNQSKDPVGNSSWKAQAQIRSSSGVRRTITLDDSRNYRTSAASDNNNAAAIADTVSYDGEGYALDSSGNRILLSGASGGDGNWIAEPFTAGHIVRVSTDSESYHLNAVNPSDFHATQNFSLQAKRMKEDGNVIETYDAYKPYYNCYRTITADSETYFVIENLEENSYKSYYGVKNVPTVSIPASIVKDNVGNFIPGPHYGDNAVAYIYHRGSNAKLVFVTRAWEVSNPTSTPSDNIVFLAAHSTSNLIESNDGIYYEVNAVVNDEIKTVQVKHGASFNSNGVTFALNNSATQKEWCCVLLNDVTYDSGNFLTRGEWQFGDDITGRYQGIRRIDDEKVRLNTIPDKNSFLKDVAENVRVYFVDGSNIRRIKYNEIVNDTQDFVYYVENDGEVTYLFIVDYTPPAEVPAVPAAAS